MGRLMIAAQPRDINGVLILDKLQGPTSNAVLQSTKSLFNARKAGHTGTLDPLATGVLPICFGEATKFSQYLICSDKKYQVKVRLGIRTNTADSLGDVIQIRPVNYSNSTLEFVLNEFRGEISQTPNIFSAIKYRGKPLYKYARQGINIPRKARTVTIYQLECTSYCHDELDFIVHCSKGTYVRSLIDDIGERLSCGAHVTMLRRTQVAKFSIKYAVTLQQLHLAVTSNNRNIAKNPSAILDSFLLPLDVLLSDLPEVQLNVASILRFSHGVPIQITATYLVEGYVRVIESETGNFIGLGEIIENSYLAPRRLLKKYC
jgi:tRNA pseudouridine55 synthase